MRQEELVSNNQNAKLDTYTLTTSSAFGKHTVSAGYFELLAPGARQARDQRLGPLRPLFGRLQPLLPEDRSQIHADPSAGLPRHLFRRVPGPDLRGIGRAQPVRRLLDLHPAHQLPGRPRRHGRRRQHQPLHPGLFAGRRLCRQSGPEAGEVAQLHPGRDRRADPVAGPDGRLLRRQVRPDRGGSAAGRRPQRLHQDQRHRRLRRRGGRGRGLLVQPGRRHRPAIPDRPAAC